MCYTELSGRMKWCVALSAKLLFMRRCLWHLSQKDTWGLWPRRGPQIREVMLTHLKELFEDVDVYGWKGVREYQAAWLQLLEQGRAEWKDEGKRAQLHRLMVWSKPSLSSRFSHPSPTPVTSTVSRPPLH